jgi:exopolysaccharide biosynthesis protein
MSPRTRTPGGRRRPRLLRRVVLVPTLVVTLTLGGATAWALDRYVIEHVEIGDVAAYEAAQSGSATAADTDDDTDADADASEATVTDTTYDSDDASIAISTVVTGSGDDTVTYYVADVTLTDATVLRSAFAQNAFGTNITETTSDIAEDNDAIFAINGDYYGFRDTGIVIRNGVVYRDEGAREGLAFYRDGTVEVYDETTTTADELVAAGVWNTLSFGPALLADGQVVDGIEDVEVDTNIGNHSIQGEQPRTAVGVIDANHLVFVVVDGRSPGYSAGVTMTDLAEIMQSLGATTAYNLDGGGSSTMYFDGALVNDPLGTGAERGTSDILYIGG